MNRDLEHPMNSDETSLKIISYACIEVASNILFEIYSHFIEALLCRHCALPSSGLPQDDLH